VAEQVAVVRPALVAALADAATARLYAGRDRSYLVWSTPGGPTLHASVHRPGHVTAPHDHGPAWAVYGVVAGPTRFHRFTRGVDRGPGLAALTAAADGPLEPGTVEVVWPGEVHGIGNPGPGWSWNLVARARDLREIGRTVFDAATGAYRVD
jgi:predicted metal-dependent enzyme (double-stranded beta helix superfamily)